MDSSMIDRLNELALEYETLLRVKQVAKYNSPLNVSEEKQKFLKTFGKGSVYNPQFIYKDSPENWSIPFIEFTIYLITTILTKMINSGHQFRQKCTSIR